MKYKHLSRIRVLQIIVILFALAISYRLYMVQIVHGETYLERADRLYVRPQQQLFDRGTIFLEDKDGRYVSGATLGTGYTLAINPSVLEDSVTTHDALQEIVDIDSEKFFYRANKADDPYEEITTRLDKTTANQISDLGIVGVDVYKDRWRYYPGGSLASRTLGFLAYDDTEERVRGVYGLERYYNDILERDENTIDVNFFAEVFANLNKTIFNQSATRIGDIVTSIEPSVQLQLEEVLTGIHNEWNSKLTAGIIIDPITGEIHALGVVPEFDLNHFSEVENNLTYANPIVENVYEMGSIIKPLTVAAGIDAEAITAETTYYDAGSIDIDDYTISNFDGKGRGYVDMQELLNQSLNTGVAFIVQEMGNDVFTEYMDAYQIGVETGIDLPNESAGLMDNLTSPRDIEYATASFGQGIATTPIATVRALSTLANGGVLITPHFAKEIQYKNGQTKKISFADGERVLKPETTETITQMLVKVVDEALLNGEVKFENYSVAAKTGTAQIANVEERGYYDDRFLHSFFGYFPAYEPRFLIFLYTVEPNGVRYASQTLTHPFADLVTFLTNYYEIPPDR